MSPEEIQERAAHILRLRELFLAAAEGASHSLLLEALLSLYITVGRTHSCCTQTAVYAAMTAVELLQTAVNSNAARPEGVPLH